MNTYNITITTKFSQVELSTYASCLADAYRNLKNNRGRFSVVSSVEEVSCKLTNKYFDATIERVAVCDMFPSTL